MEQVFKDEKYFDPTGSYFGPIIDQHDKYNKNWLPLRKFFAANADYLVGKVLSIPTSKRPLLYTDLESELYDNFLFTGEKDKQMFERNYKGNVFDPWANYWCGKWSNNKLQYHIWDKTTGRAGKYLQVVTQTAEDSVKNFADTSNIKDMVLKDQVNLAINVSTKENGITGWVRKNKVQMPHIGYLIDEKTLIWLAIERNESNIDDFNGRWHMFLEWTDSVSSPTRYNIYLNTFEVKSGAIDEKATVYKGCANYHNHTPGDSIADCEKYTCVP